MVILSESLFFFYIWFSIKHAMWMLSSVRMVLLLTSVLTVYILYLQIVSYNWVFLKYHWSLIYLKNAVCHAPGTFCLFLEQGISDDLKCILKISDKVLGRKSIRNNDQPEQKLRKHYLKVLGMLLYIEYRIPFE